MEYLNIAFIAPNQQVVVDDLIQIISKNNCHLEESRLSVLGDNFAGILRIAGNWNGIAKTEEAIASLKNQGTVLLEVKRSEPLHLEGEYLPYMTQVVGLDTPGMVFSITQFFAQQQIQLIDVQIDPFQTSHSDTSMITVSLRIGIPADINIADLRERFMILCDELNIDGIMEPEKR